MLSPQEAHQKASLAPFSGKLSNLPGISKNISMFPTKLPREDKVAEGFLDSPEFCRDGAVIKKKRHFGKNVEILGE